MENERAESVLASCWTGVATGASVTRFFPQDSLSGAAFWRVTGPAGDYCLRRWPEEAATPGRVEAVHRVLAHVVAGLPGAVPEPVCPDGGETVLRRSSGCWELTRWVAGEANYHAGPSAVKRRNAARLLARVHRAMESLPLPPSTPPGVPGLEKRSERLRGEVRIADVRGGGPLASTTARLADEVRRCLERARTVVEAARRRPLPLQWCVGDARAEHVLFDGEEAVGMVDFGAAGVDSVAADLARLLRGLAGSDGEQWRDCLAAYREVRPLLAVEADAVAAFDLGGMVAAGLNWLDWTSGDSDTGTSAEAAGARMSWLADQLAGMPPHPLD